jgi:hypothetical protein
MSSERQERPVPFDDYVAKSTAVSALSGGAFVLLSVYAALGELLAVGMTCDDTCAGAQPPPGADWTQYSEAAQWTALGVLAGLNAAIALAATALTVFGHRRSAGALVVLFGAASVLLVVLDSEAGQGPFSYLWFLASALGLVTVLAAGRR